MESEWGKNAKINHSKREHLGVVPFGTHVQTGSKQVSKRSGTALTTGGAFISGQT